MFDDYMIVVPASKTQVDHGSAMVTKMVPDADGYVIVHFESNRYRASNMERFVEKLYHAASRAATRYPTTAKQAFRKEDLKVVGKFNLTSRRITNVTDSSSLKNWAGEIGDLRV
ncbi:hypothetical protein [Stenotrophomonas maltophilia]|uniref:hypothetical protein n=1 Tax=Stenotrophomonas maltophilia TaxID=40324 RepID=UPI0021CAD8AA|nr:hypothetical protein [Stenotrophomonas maltophilia]MCU1136955.1 hypothetical protein [Stenotrophomonas maltophilia]